MARKANGVKISIAVIHNELCHLKEQHQETNANIKEIKTLLMSFRQETSENTSSIKNVKWALGIIFTLLMSAITVVAALR